MANSSDMRRFYASVGEFMIQYAIVQAVLRSALLTMLSVDGHGGRHLLYGMSDEVVIRKLQVAINGNGKRHRHFLKVLPLLSEVAQFRNQLVHWVPHTDPQRTKVEAFVDAYRNFKNPNNPQISCSSIEVVHLTKWLRILEWDIATLTLSIRNNEKFDADMMRSTDEKYRPNVPKAETKARPNGK